MQTPSVSAAKGRRSGPHNLKVVGSNPTPATNQALENTDVFKGFFVSGVSQLANWQTIGKQFDSNGRRRMPRPAGYRAPASEGRPRPYSMPPA